MKFIYEYRTRDNELRSGVISASSREAVYAELKKSGIKPSRVNPAPGFLNYLSSKKKPVAFFAIVVITAGIAMWFGTQKSEGEYKEVAQKYEEAAPKAAVYNDFVENKTRRQIIGDAAIIEKGIRTGWSDVFVNEGERFLASFAIPGVPAGQRSTNEAELKAALKRTILPTEADNIEARQIKAMVEGMKNELRTFINDGGSIKEFGDCLVNRQEAELGYYNRAVNELEMLHRSGMTEKELEKIWEDRNSKLRMMGIKLIAMPE